MLIFNSVRLYHDIFYKRTEHNLHLQSNINNFFCVYSEINIIFEAIKMVVIKRLENWIPQSMSFDN